MKIKQTKTALINPGDNLPIDTSVYTCPAGKTAIIFGSVMKESQGTSGDVLANSEFYINDRLLVEVPATFGQNNRPIGFWEDDTIHLLQENLALEAGDTISWKRGGSTLGSPREATLWLSIVELNDTEA